MQEPRSDTRQESVDAGGSPAGERPEGEGVNVAADLVKRVDSGVLWLTLNRPDSANALTPGMRDELSAALEDASGDLGVRCVVITAEGTKGFCTGADLRATSRGASYARGVQQVAGGAPRPQGAPEHTLGDAARTIRKGWQRLVEAVLDCEKPVVAGVNATAAGGGMHLALACDIVIAAQEARFIEVFVRRGLAPDAGGAYLLARLIGPQRAKELFFFGDDLSAKEAYRIGLVNRVVPRLELRETLAEVSQRLARSPTKAIGVAKRLVNQSLEVDRATSFWEEAAAQELVNATVDAREGMMSFVERREPDFKGW